MRSTVLFASRLMTAKNVTELSKKIRDHLIAGEALQANILLLRYAGRRSDMLLRKEVEEYGKHNCGSAHRVPVTH